MRYYLSILFQLLFIRSLMAAEPGVSMNLGLRRQLVSTSDENRMVTVLIKGQTACVREEISSRGGIIVSAAGDISSARVPLRGLASLLHSTCISRIEAYPQNVQVLNDTMRMLCRVNEVHQGLPPLTKSYTGKGILMGYIDSGLDYRHPDFQDSLGHTRVAWLWDMTKPIASNTPQPYGYGQEWDSTDIDNGLASSHTGEDEYGHGTYVAGIGSGNGRAVGHFQGVAPESELLIVSFDFNAHDTIARMADAMDYLFSKASQLGKPIVINASLGDYYGSHDGKDLESQYISNLINAQAGRVVVAAVGNAGSYPFHVGQTSVSGDTSFTWFKYNSSYPGAYVQIFADTADMNQLRFSIGADKVNPYFEFRGATPFTTVLPAVNNVITQNVFNGLNRIGVVQMLASENEGVYELEIFVIPDSTTYNWRFTCTGPGHFDSWSFDWEFQNLPSSSTFPDILNYHSPDTMQTMVTGMACLDNVITVGNFFNTDRHVDINGTLQITPTDEPGNLAPNSSRGPTRDGRIKPEITAPGHHIISAGVLSLIPGMISAQPYKVAPGGYHITGGGTSASAPVVAGIAALYLEQNPNLSWNSVKNSILNCAAQDQFTWGPRPNNGWGYGKADAFGVLTACGVVGVEEHNTINSDQLSFYPNPTRGSLHLNLDSEQDIYPVKVRVIEPCGRIVREFELSGSNSVLDLNHLSEGIYGLYLVSNKNACTFKSFVVTK